MESLNFLKQKYWPKEEFRKAAGRVAKRTEKRTGDKVPQKPEAQIENYLKRFQEIFNRENSADREHGIDTLKRLLYSKYTVKPENISDDYIKGVIFGNFAELKGYEREDLKNEEIKKQIQDQFKKEIGQDFERYDLPDEEKDKVREMAVRDQKNRISIWLYYLTRPEAENISPVFRYWAFAEMLKLGDYDPNRKLYNKRTETTVANFPELDQQALAMVFDETRRNLKGEPQAIQLEDEDKQKEFKKSLKNENFGQLYAFMLEHVNSLRLPTERLIITDGEWKLFPKGSSAKELAEPLQGFNTKWCIAGEGTAEGYLAHSDMWIYFSQDANGNNSIPRACVVDSKEKGITEVRGIISSGEATQHLDDYIAPIIDEKLGELPGGEKWRDNMTDMKKLAQLHLKHLSKKPFSKDDLIFIYEIDKPIQESGYGRDPRIDETRKTRNSEEDMPIVFECEPEQIATDISGINEDTKAYVGPWSVEVFQAVRNCPNITHLYESFPDKKILMMDLETDPSINSSQKAKEKMDSRNIYRSDRGNNILDKTKFSQKKEKYSLVRFTVEQLGFKNGATTEKIYKRAEELGLELCPAEVGPHLRLQYSGKEWMLIAIKQIAGHDGVPGVFSLDADGGQLVLDGDDTKPSDWWHSGSRFVFRFRK